MSYPDDEHHVGVTILILLMSLAFLVGSLVGGVILYFVQRG